MTVFERVEKIVYIFADESAVKLDMDTDLFSDVGLDSFELSQVMCEIEMEFGLTEETWEVNLKDIRKMKALVEHIEKQMSV